MKTIVTYSPSLGNEVTTDVTFDNVGKTKTIYSSDDRWVRATLVRVIEESTSLQTGSCMVTLEYSNGRKFTDTHIIAKKKKETKTVNLRLPAEQMEGEYKLDL